MLHWSGFQTAPHPLETKSLPQHLPLSGARRLQDSSSKPTVCALYPLGRAYIAPKDKLVYFCQPLTCGSNKKMHTVREWLAAFGLTFADEDSMRWMRLTPRLTLWMLHNESKLRQKNAARFGRICRTSVTFSTIFSIPSVSSLFVTQMNCCRSCQMPD